MPRALAETVALLLLAATLAFAVVRPRGLPEAVAAVPAALLAVALGVLPARAALDELRDLGPTIGFLAAVLLLAELCDREGLFEAAGRRMAAAARGRPVALLGLVFGVGSAVTAALSLDATVVLLTPVVFATAARLRLRPKPHVYACTHLANSASLLLPVSNLTNLLAFRASGLSFARFGATMALPWLAAIGVEWLALRRFFASDLVGRGELVADTQAAAGGGPRFATAVLALTLAGFGVASLAGVDPALVAEAVMDGTGANWQLANLMPRKVLAGDFTAGFKVAHMAKDLRIASEVSGELGVETPVLALTRARFEETRERYGADVDYGSVARLAGW